MVKPYPTSKKVGSKRGRRHLLPCDPYSLPNATKLSPKVASLPSLGYNQLDVHLLFPPHVFARHGHRFGSYRWLHC